MKKLFPILFIAFLSIVLLSSAAWGQSAFTPGNLVVLQIGDGSGLVANQSIDVSLVEYTTSGTVVQTIAVPDGGTGTGLSVSGSSTSESHLSRSVDGRYLVFAGFDAAAYTVTVTSNPANTENRIIALVDYQANMDFSTKINDATIASGDIRSVATKDGSAFWATTSANGVRYVPFGNTSASVQLSTAPTNTRVANIYDGQLFITSASTIYQGIARVGAGLQTTSGQTTVLLSGFPTASGPSSYNFSISSDSATAYVADDRVGSAGGGVQKWTRSGSTWTLQYTLHTGSYSGMRGLLVDWSGTNPVIYATNATPGSVPGNDSLLTVTDAGSSSAFTLLATAAANYVFRGVAWAPLQNALPVELVSFTGIARGNKVELNWSTATEINNSGFAVERKTQQTPGRRLHSLPETGRPMLPIATATSTQLPPEHTHTA